MEGVSLIPFGGRTPLIHPTAFVARMPDHRRCRDWGGGEHLV